MFVMEIRHILSQVRLTCEINKVLKVLHAPNGLNQSRHECTNYDLLLANYRTSLTNEHCRILKNHVNQFLLDILRQQMIEFSNREDDLNKKLNTVEESQKATQEELKQLRKYNEESRKEFENLILQIQQEKEKEEENQLANLSPLNLTRLFNDTQRYLIDELESIKMLQSYSYSQQECARIKQKVKKIDAKIAAQIQCKENAIKIRDEQIKAWYLEKDQLDLQILKLEISLSENAILWEYDDYLKQQYLNEQRKKQGLEARLTYINRQIESIMDHPSQVLEVQAEITHLKIEREQLELDMSKLEEHRRQNIEAKRREVIYTLRELEAMIKKEPSLCLDCTVFDLIRDTGISFS